MLQQQLAPPPMRKKPPAAAAAGVEPEEVAGLELEAAVFAIEELEETAKLAMMLRGLKPNLLTDLHISDLKTHFNIDWD